MELETVDNWYSKLVRLRAADEHGDLRCFICDRSLPWKEAVVGHYIKRRHMATRCDDRNVHPMCQYCNSLDETDEDTHEIHRVSIELIHGLGTAEELKLLKNKEVHITKAELTALGESFRNEFKNRQKA